MLVKAGMRTVQMIGVPTKPLPDDIDAVVIALKSRTAPVQEAVRESLGALRFLQAGGCHQFYFKALVGFRGVGSGSCDQGGDERTEQGFAATACVVHELEEPEIERQLVLRETPVRAEPGAQQGPEPFHGVDVHLAEPVTIFVARILTAGMADRFV